MNGTRTSGRAALARILVAIDAGTLCPDDIDGRLAALITREAS